MTSMRMDIVHLCLSFKSPAKTLSRSRKFGLKSPPPSMLDRHQLEILHSKWRRRDSEHSPLTYFDSTPTKTQNPGFFALLSDAEGVCHCGGRAGEHAGRQRREDRGSALASLSTLDLIVKSVADGLPVLSNSNIVLMAVNFK
jgi:hypothetical protein